MEEDELLSSIDARLRRIERQPLLISALCVARVAQAEREATSLKADRAKLLEANKMLRAKLRQAERTAGQLQAQLRLANANDEAGSDQAEPLVLEKGQVAGFVAGYVTQELGLPADALESSSRRRPYVLARWCYWHILREVQELSLPELGRQLGYNHTTVLHGLSRLQDELKANPELVWVDQVVAQLRAARA